MIEILSKPRLGEGEKKKMIIAFSKESNVLSSSVSAATAMLSICTSGGKIVEESDAVFCVERASSLSSASILSMSALSSYESTDLTGNSALSEESISSFDSTQMNGLSCSNLKCDTSVTTTTSNSVNKCRKRSLKFDLSKNTIRILYNDYSDCTWNVDDFWYTNKEQDEMKEQSKIDAREWRRQGYHVLLNDTFECPRNDVQDYLNAFVQLPDRLNRRGLERQCSRKHGEERSELKENSRHVVFRTQQEFKKLYREGNATTSDAEVSNNTHSAKYPTTKMDIYEQTLSLCYIKSSRSAKVYARNLGRADEVEVQRLLGKINDPTKISSYQQRMSSNFLTDNATSELVERILEQNGILTPDNQRRIQRRLSNYSATSVNSFDSHRHHQAAIMKTNNNVNSRNGYQHQPYQQQQQQQQYHHDSNSSVCRSRINSIDVDYEYNAYGVASPKFMATPTKTRKSSISSTSLIPAVVSTPRTPMKHYQQQQQTKQGPQRHNNCPRSVGPVPTRFVGGGSTGVNRIHPRRLSNNANNGRRGSDSSGGPPTGMSEALYASIA